MKKLASLLIFFAVILSVKAQDSTIIPKPFFSTNIAISEKNLSEFYSSFNINNNSIIFNANNYNIYSINKQTGTIEWEFYAGRKTNRLPFFHGNSVIIGIYVGEYAKCVRLNLSSGKLIQTLNIESLKTQPFFKDSIMYVTAIANSGQLIAYDLKADSIIWAKFIAHGVETQPYFLENKIIANAEEDNWFEIDYNGQLLDTTCKNKADLFVEDIKCVRNFKFLTHDNKEITELFIEKQFEYNSNVKVKTTTEKTFILGDNKLLIIGKKMKILKTIEIETIVTLPETYNNERLEILKIENNTIWLFYKDVLVVYDFEKNQIIKEQDFSYWSAHQVMLDKNNIWLISRNDGQLYGFTLE